MEKIRIHRKDGTIEVEAEIRSVDISKGYPCAEAVTNDGKIIKVSKDGTLGPYTPWEAWDETITTTRAAEIAGVTPRTIQGAIWRGALKAQRSQRRGQERLWEIELSDLEEALEAGRIRPRK